MNTNVQLLSKTGKESHPESNCYLAEVIEDEKSKKWHWIRKCKVFVLTSICIGLTFLLLFLPEAIANYNLVTGCYLSDKHFCHQMNQNIMTDFVRFTQIVLKIKTYKHLCLEFQNNLCKFLQIWQNHSLYFGLQVNLWQKPLFLHQLT